MSPKVTNKGIDASNRTPVILEPQPAREDGLIYWSITPEGQQTGEVLILYLVDIVVFIVKIREELTLYLVDIVIFYSKNRRGVNILYG